MNKDYRPAEIEGRHYARWEAAGYFAPAGSGEPYCIVIPPPNVTGTLHMGHALQDTIMDALTRYQRMQGKRALWQPGTDHAGIATQMVVERLLAREGTSRTQLGRERFLERVWQWKERSGNTIQQQLRRLGASVDWTRDRFTMDEGLSRAVTEVFVRLHEEGLIYRGKRLVNWDPVLQTALSDLEVLSSEERGKLWHLRYPLADEPQKHLVVATTRPETMLGDTAVAVHPDDERYRHLIGKDVVLPLANRRIPVIGDEYVDPEFGTGCVKITPAHDFNDYEVGQRHNLPQISVLDFDAKLNENAPPAYRGLDRFAARKRIVADLEAAGLLDRITDHTSMIPKGDRSNVVVEPMLTDQWYVRIKPLAEPAIAAVEDGRVKFVPENWSKTYFEWMHNIQDWCISRQLWWGHRIPAWYDDAGNIYVGRDESRRAPQAQARKGVATAPGRGRARHVVLFGALAVLDARLAGQDAGAQDVLSDECARHELRHHLLLGRAHDDDGAQVHGRRPVPRGLHPRPRARSRRQQDVEVERQHLGPARPHQRRRSPNATAEAHRRAHARPHAGQHRENDAQGVPERHRRRRHGRAAVHVRLVGHDGPRRTLRPRARRRLPPLLQQALERLGVCIQPARRHRRRAACARHSGSLDPLAAAARRSLRSTTTSRPTASISSHRRSTTSRGTSSAIGTSS